MGSVDDGCQFPELVCWNVLECGGKKHYLTEANSLFGHGIWAWYRSNRAPKKWNAKNSSNDQTSVELKFVHTCLKLGNGFQR
jgi:hypothetical protein